MKAGCRKAMWTVGGFVAASTALLAALNTRMAKLARDPGPAIDAPRDEYAWDGGRVSYYRAGAGHPVLLLHSHNAAGSAYEMRHIFQSMAQDYQVFAPDLPGYGSSERRARTYSWNTYVRFLHDFVHDVIQAPAAVVASSLSATHAIMAVREDAHSFTHLVAISPTGLTSSTVEPPGVVRSLGNLLSLPVWGQAVYNGIASRSYITRFLQSRVYNNPWHVTHEMVDHAWHSAHQAHARHAPSGFLNGALWTDARVAYEDIRRPLLLIWGENDRLNPYERSARSLARNPDARVEILPNVGAAPYDEQTTEFYRIVASFLTESGAPPVKRGNGK